MRSGCAPEPEEALRIPRKEERFSRYVICIKLLLNVFITNIQLGGYVILYSPFNRPRKPKSLLVALMVVLLLAQLGVVVPAALAATNLAAGKPVAATGYNDVYVPVNVNDGNQATYWESSNNAFPQTIRVDLGSVYAINQAVLKLPADWGSRSQTLSVLGSLDDATYTTLSGSASYTFDPASSNIVTINLPTTSARYVKLTFTANSGWPAAQLSEFEVYGTSTDDTQAPTAPANLTYTTPASGQIKLTWNASTDNVGVTGYDIFAGGSLRASVAGNVLTYTDNQPVTATVSYYVVAKDAAGNVSTASNTVTRNGNTGGGTNLAAGKTVTASSNTQTYVAANSNDGNVASYWKRIGRLSGNTRSKLGCERFPFVS
ncbi:discoidin domain-containing protein [Paenibacillus hexagrammi]|uniref:Discoidin domain-containing protein n=1 Tax=Paenibacillus hexagrammi TaxID=2908839 RepID=A0ABY3SE15_9BACL|nr:discoidin domain-containing protein [Paenibacillus sp. YPD9-1]UJF31464.1 discoidin domain-containing protein [Paenibacillus sp. YPD9-1]